VSVDDNHKPEMAIAITPFEGLCGFRPLNEISHFLANVPAFRRLVGETEANDFEQLTKGNEIDASPNTAENNKEALRAAFSSLMKSSKEEVAEWAKTLVESAEKEGSSFAGSGGPSNTGSELAELVIRLNKQFPGDIGLFNLFFLNYVKLSPGEALFLKADDIHAYISGDIIECMASSDNVVRAGFTPKYQDIPTLTSMLTYSYAPIEEQKMNPVDYPYVTLNTTAYSSNSSSLLYDPPIEEFSVVRTELMKKGSKATFEALSGPSIIICTKGEGKISVGPKTEDIKEGYVFFVGATAQCVIESTGGEEMVTFKAFCELEEKESNGHRL
jgi:mannose-6-phosphate isomerase